MKENSLFWGASACLFPLIVGIAHLGAALRLVRSTLLLICVSWLLKLFLWWEHQRCGGVFSYLHLSWELAAKPPLGP